MHKHMKNKNIDCGTYFQSSFEDFLSFGTSHSAVDSNLFITTNTKRPNSVAGLGEDGLLAG